jgi:hypothetical protein
MRRAILYGLDNLSPFSRDKEIYLALQIGGSSSFNHCHAFFSPRLQVINLVIGQNELSARYYLYTVQVAQTFALFRKQSNSLLTATVPTAHFSLSALRFENWRGLLEFLKNWSHDVDPPTLAQQHQ